jgi:hypothetical protein
MAVTQTEILKKAEQLASTLAGGTTKVGKNVLLSIVADFMSSPHPDRERLRRTLQLLQEGNGGHTKRGGGYGDQIRAAVREVAKELGADTSDEELKSLFGWTARLLLVRREGSPAREVKKPGPWKPASQSRSEAPAVLPAVPASTVLPQGRIWDDALLGWHLSSPAIFRGKEVAVCPPEVAPPELLAALKMLKKKTELRCKAEVVKALGGLRVARIVDWRKVEK